MRLWYSPESLSDVKRIIDYIKNDLQNPSAAETVAKRIMHSCSLLKEMPYMGISLSSRIEVGTDWYYLITGNYIVFYRLETSAVHIIRILDTRTDYINVIKELL